MKHQALFSSKDKSKKLKCRLLQFLFSPLRVTIILLLEKKQGAFIRIKKAFQVLLVSEFILLYAKTILTVFTENFSKYEYFQLFQIYDL